MKLDLDAIEARAKVGIVGSAVAAGWIHVLREDVPALVARVRELEADYAAIAHALGIEHVPEQGPTWPGPIDAVLQDIALLRASERKLLEIELKACPAPSKGEP